MLRDVFYYGNKPNVHPREQYAENLADARNKATTRDFWIINEFSDYRNFDWDFDFEFLPDEDVWAENHNNVWPSQWQKDSGTWLCPKEHSDIIIYRSDVDPVIRKNEKQSDNWVELDLIDHTKFDFSWHPDPTDPPYIYKWGCKFYPAQLKHVLEYRVPGATQEKYMTSTVELLPHDYWVEHQLIDKHKFDMTWRPNPLDPPYIYVWGNKYIDGKLRPTLEYHAPDATDKKYMPELIDVLPEWDRWVEVQDVDKSKFDFSWRPDPREPAYIYTWGNKWINAEDRPTLEYHAEGATDRKYMTNDVPVLPEKDRWKILKPIDNSSFDFTWRPDPKEPPFTYVFGNEYYDAVKMPTVMYSMIEGPEIKYVDFQKAKLLSDSSKYQHLEDSTLEDYSWVPDPDAPPYIYAWGNQWNKPEDKISIQYVVEGATEYKYMETRATRKPCMDNWAVPSGLDVSNFDFSWEPNPNDEPYIYEFGTQWQKTGGPQYIVPSATEKKYVDVQKAIKLPSKQNWKVLGDIATSGFDFSWHPDSTSPPYVYVFGNQWNNATNEPTVEYHTPGATQVKYIDDLVAKLKPNKTNWIIPDNLDTSKFDFSWRPNPHSPPYIYEFGTQWQKTGGPRYIVEGGTTVKYEDVQTAIRLPDAKNFVTMHGMKIKSFDYSWHPDSTEEPYIYVFGNQWHPAEKEPTIEYRMPGATEKKYVSSVVATLEFDMDNWEIPEDIDTSDFDFSWRPDPYNPAYIYQFGTIEDPDNGPRYITPDNNGEIVRLERVTISENVDAEYKRYTVETTLEDLVAEHPNEIFWALNKDIDYSNFDFDWRPSIEQAEYVHAFGSSESERTQTYLINGPRWIKGYRDLNWVEDTKLDDKTLYNLFKKSDIFFVDRGNSESNVRFEALKEKFGSQIQKTRYLNSWVDTVNRCINRSTTEMLWILNSELDYTNFDFEYYPNPWQMKMVHVFGTQHSHWGTTFLVNRESFPEDTKYIKIIEHLSNLNFIKHIRARATSCTHDIVMINHGNMELTKVVEQVEKCSGRTVLTTINYDNSYLDTLKSYIKKLPEKKEHYLWICSSVCDYSMFDFTYVCDPFAKDNLHVFPSGTQKFGDTFFIDVNKTKEIIDDMEKLEDYHKVNFNNHVKTSRLPEPVIVTSEDTHIAAAKNVTGFPYATLVTEDNLDIEDTLVEPMNLWAPDTKNILITSTGATRIVVPTEAKNHVTNELYEYPYIKRMPKLAKSKAHDIVFVSNGETVADQNFEHLTTVTNGLANRIHRVDGINGRTEALHAAAESSETPWFFCVPAKLFVNKKFDWNYQADRMQMPKHYIFNALNPVNDLFYGHQSMVLYNKNLILANQGVGLDFTLDSPHMSVELNSGIVVGDTDPYSTWRTAFREAVKLRKYSENGDEVAKQRLDIWTSVGKGNYGEWSIKGALDGIEFYNEVDGDLAKLRQSYYWDWLKARYESKY